jgi:hypothetical protein
MFVSKMGLKGRFKVVHCDANGNEKGTYEFPNGITTEGLNHVLDASFHNQAATATWYIGLIDATSGYTGLAAGDTAAQINGTNGWDELTSYTEANRVEWNEDAAAAGSITNSSTSDFSINATVSIKGIFVVSTNTKSGTTGVLWSTAAFASDVAAVNGDTLKITYTVSG